MSFQIEIRKIRIRCLMSQMEFAEAIGVSFATVNRWENGKNRPNFQTIKRIAKFCETKSIEFDVFSSDEEWKEV